MNILLLERTIQCVVCGGYTSDPANVISGVPQGTVLGLLLFLIYINDLPECVSSMCSLFADDCLVYRKMESERNIENAIFIRIHHAYMLLLIILIDAKLEVDILITVC